MLSKGTHKGALITREAYLALLDLKSLIEIAAEKAHVAGLDSVSLALSPRPVGDPLRALKMASDTLQSPAFDSAVAEARTKIDMAMAWHKEAANPLPKP
ncbi:MAG TPA: hypothetical protein VE263_14345 [Candidatus Angelobacter sp.]|nr:hypothetical protein [Candidatus Angelobacter sp.]